MFYYNRDTFRSEKLHVVWKKDDISDKIWGIMEVRRNPDGTLLVLTFWGRRGKKLSMKSYELSQYNAIHKLDCKIDDGYEKITTDQLYSFCPDYEEQIKKHAVWASLSF